MPPTGVPLWKMSRSPSSGPASSASSRRPPSRTTSNRRDSISPRPAACVSASRSSMRRIFPVSVFGSSSVNSIRRG